MIVTIGRLGQILAHAQRILVVDLVEHHAICLLKYRVHFLDVRHVVHSVGFLLELHKL